MVISQSDLNTALGDILAKTTETEVKKVINVYDQTKSAKENIKLLVATSTREALKDSATFLKNLSTEYPVQVQTINSKSRNKDEYATDIVNFIEFLKPTLCLICNENYVPTGEDHGEDDTLKCYLCKRPSHSKCFSSYEIHSNIGIIFLCSECLSRKAADELAEELKKADTDVSQPSTDVTQPPTEQSDNPDKTKPANTDDPKENAEEANTNTADCPLYLKRICPHGLTGKREINGQPCPLKHRKLCIYFSKYGPSGCRFKKNCRYLHPTVCNNSLQLQMCLNKSCKDYHFHGTERRIKDHTKINKPSTNLQQNTKQPHMGQPWPSTNQTPILNQSSHIQPWTESHANQDSLCTEKSKDFLGKNMLDLRNELQSFSASMIKSTIESSLPHLIKAVAAQLIPQSNLQRANLPQEHTQQTHHQQQQQQPHPQQPQQTHPTTHQPQILYASPIYNQTVAPV